MACYGVMTCMLWIGGVDGVESRVAGLWAGAVRCGGEGEQHLNGCVPGSQAVPLTTSKAVVVEVCCVGLRVFVIVKVASCC